MITRILFALLGFASASQATTLHDGFLIPGLVCNTLERTAPSSPIHTISIYGNQPTNGEKTPSLQLIFGQAVPAVVTFKTAENTGSSTITPATFLEIGERFWIVRIEPNLILQIPGFYRANEPYEPRLTHFANGKQTRLVCHTAAVK